MVIYRTGKSGHCRRCTRTLGSLRSAATERLYLRDCWKIFLQTVGGGSRKLAKSVTYYPGCAPVYIFQAEYRSADDGHSAADRRKHPNRARIAPALSNPNERCVQATAPRITMRTGSSSWLHEAVANCALPGSCSSGERAGDHPGKDFESSLLFPESAWQSGVSVRASAVAGTRPIMARACWWFRPSRFMHYASIHDYLRCWKRPSSATRSTALPFQKERKAVWLKEANLPRWGGRFCSVTMHAGINARPIWRAFVPCPADWRERGDVLGCAGRPSVRGARSEGFSDVLFEGVRRGVDPAEGIVL